MFDRLFLASYNFEWARAKLLIIIVAALIVGCTPRYHLDDQSKPYQSPEASRGDAGLDYDRRSEVRTVPWAKSNDTVRDIGGHTGYVMPSDKKPPEPDRRP
jgi:hypothetical protein